MRWNIIVECVKEDGEQSTITLGTIERLAGLRKTSSQSAGIEANCESFARCRSEATVQEHFEQRRKCPPVAGRRLKTSAASPPRYRPGDRAPEGSADTVEARLRVEQELE